MKVINPETNDGGNLEDHGNIKAFDPRAGRHDWSNENAWLADMSLKAWADNIKLALGGGKEGKKTLVLIVGGVNFVSGSSVNGSSLESKINNWAETSKTKNVVTKTFSSQYDEDALICAQMLIFIAENVTKDVDDLQIILVGYSWGGDTQLELTDILNSCTKPIPVDLVVTVDPADGPFAHNSDSPYKIADNVKRAINYYQPNVESISYSGNTQITPMNGIPNPNYVNIPVTDADAFKSKFLKISHQNINEVVAPRVFNNVVNRIINR